LSDNFSRRLSILHQPVGSVRISAIGCIVLYKPLPKIV